MSDDRFESDTPSYMNETLDEHRGCLQLIAKVEACLDRKPGDPERWVTELHDASKELAGGLQEHFRSEERGPMFKQLPTSHPRLAEALEKLKAEHSIILEEIASAIARAEALQGPEVFQLRELNARVQILIARIRRHEAEENELVIRAYWNESGMGD